MDERRSPASAPQLTAFDRALEFHELRYAADVYASRYGVPGSVAYRDAWLRFRRHVASLEDLQRVRTASARGRDTRGLPARSALTHELA